MSYATHADVEKINGATYTATGTPTDSKVDDMCTEWSLVVDGMDPHSEYATQKKKTAVLMAVVEILDKKRNAEAVDYVAVNQLITDNLEDRPRPIFSSRADRSNVDDYFIDSSDQF